MTEIYNHWSHESMSNAIGHVDNDGVVYNHWSHESTSNAVGHIGKDGVIYDHWSHESMSNAVGHVGKDGVVYNHWSYESMSNAIGHVGKDGVVYDHWSHESMSNAVGHVKGPATYGAGAALLLLLAGNGCGGSSSGYGGSGSAAGSGSGSSSGGSSGGGSVPGFAMILGLLVMGGLIYILTSEARIANAATILAIGVNAVAAIYFLWKLAAGKMHFALNGKRFAKGLVAGVAVYVAATAILVLLGLGSNIGTGHAISDDGGDQMELAAMFLGVPFVVEGLFCEGPKPGSKKSGKSAKPATPKPAPKPAPKPSPKPATPVKPEPETMLDTCPRCRAQLRVPAGKGWIRITCPKCGTSFEMKT